MKQKRLVAILMALALIVSMGMSALAAGGTITIDQTKGDTVVKSDGQVYNAYKIFDIDSYKGTAPDIEYVYTISNTNPWFALLSGTTNTFVTLTQIGTSDKYNVAPVAGYDAAAFAAYLIENAGSISADVTATAANGKAEITVTTDGYYLVDSTLGALCMMYNIIGDLDIIEKNNPPVIVKSVNEAANASYSIGDTVPFKVVITAGGAADTTYVLTDTMSAGLTLNENSFAVQVGGIDVDDSNYVINTIPTAADTWTFQITFIESYTAALAAGTEITVTYDAILNEDAVTGTVDPNTNKATLTYGNSTTVEEETEVYTYEFDIVKTDEEGEILDGEKSAEFKLYTAATGGTEIALFYFYDAAGGYYRPALTGETASVITAGVATVKGLKAGTYYLEETKAPDGYNMLTERFPVILNGNIKAEYDIEDMYLVETGVQIINVAGIEMPSTGGIGTTLFAIVGVAIILGGCTLLIVNRKKVFGK